MLPHLFPRLTVSGALGGLLGALFQLETHTGISLDTIVTSALAGVCILLFTMFIKQGNRLARMEGEMALAKDVSALDAYSRRNKEELDRLDTESRSVDKRIEASRHLVKNEMTPVIGQVELRAAAESEALWASIRNLDDRITRHIEKGAA